MEKPKSFRVKKMVGQLEIVQFLRCISRINLRQRDREHIANFLKNEVPWENVTFLAEKEGVAGFLFYHLKHLGLIEHLPGAIRRNLEESYRRTTQKTLTVVAEAVALSELLKQVRVPVLALQGLSVVRLYGDPGLRPMEDADFMVKPGLKEKLKIFLIDAGYRRPDPRYPDLLYKNGVFLDIHTHILNLERIQNRRHLFHENLTPMWIRAMPYFDQQDYLLRLDPYDNIIALAAHALKHSYSRLIWLVDLHELLLTLADSPDFWARLVERARFWKQETVLLYAMILMEGIFNVTIPLWIKHGLGIKRMNILERHIIRLKLRGFSSDELCIALWLFNIKGMGNRLKFMRETVFPREEIMSQIFPRGSGESKGLDYVRRMVNTLILLCKNARQLLQVYFRL